MHYWIDRDWGAGMLNTGYAICNNCTFSNNYKKNGGAIFSQGHLIINNCTFSNNKAYGNGNDVCIGDDGTVEYNGKKICKETFKYNKHLKELFFAESISTGKSSLAIGLSATFSFGLGFAAGALTANPFTGLAVGAGIGAIIGGAISSVIISKTYDVNYDRIKSTLITVALDTATGSAGGFIGGIIYGDYLIIGDPILHNDYYVNDFDMYNIYESYLSTDPSSCKSFFATSINDSSYNFVEASISNGSLSSSFEQGLQNYYSFILP